MAAIGKGLIQVFWLAAALVLLAVSTDVSAKLYRWVDEDGVVHYSDKLPPEHAKDAHEELDEQGQTVNDVERAKTEEERRQEELKRQKEEELQQQGAEEQARERRRDQILLQTFTTERDLIITRDDRLESIDSIISLTQSNNKRLEDQIEDTEQRIERIEKSGRDVPENVAQKLESLRAQYEKNEVFMENKRQERQNVETRFEADLKRFRELKGEEESGDSGQAETAPEEAEQSATPPATEAAASNPPGEPAGNNNGE